MGTELARHEGGGALAPNEWQAMRDQAQTLVRSGFLPKAVNTPEKAVAIIMTGRELGIPPMQALRQIHVIEGKPTLSAELTAALILSRYPGATWEVLSNNERCSVTAGRPGQKATTITWTLDDAKRAGLLGKSVWRNYPRAMLRSRATSEAARLVFPHVSMGMYDPEELDADEFAEPSQPETVTTTATVEPAAPAVDWEARLVSAATLQELDDVARDIKRAQPDGRPALIDTYKRCRADLEAPNPEDEEPPAALMREPGDDSYPDTRDGASA